MKELFHEINSLIFSAAMVMLHGDEDAKVAHKMLFEARWKLNDLMSILEKKIEKESK